MGPAAAGQGRWSLRRWSRAGARLAPPLPDLARSTASPSAAERRRIQPGRRRGVNAGEAAGGAGSAGLGAPGSVRCALDQLPWRCPETPTQVGAAVAGGTRGGPLTLCLPSPLRAQMSHRPSSGTGGYRG